MSGRLAARWYLRLMKLTPRRLRDRHRDEMTEMFLETLDAARARGAVAVLGVWLRAVVDLVSGSRRRADRHESRTHDADGSAKARVESVWRDVRNALRGYQRTPLFATVIVATLALAIGSTSAIFAVVNAVVFQPLPFPESDRMIQISQHRSDTSRELSLSPPNYFDLTAESRSLLAAVAYSSGTNTVQAPGGTPERMRTTVVTSQLGVVGGMHPILGRLFTDADDQPGAPRVIVLSHHVWQRHFGAAPAVIGLSVSVDDSPATIIGVMPDGFLFPDSTTDIWMPMRLSRTTPANPAIPKEQYRDYRVLSVVGRLRPGASLTQAQAEIGGIGGVLARNYPVANREMSFTIAPLKDATVGSVRRAMFLFLAGVVGLLLVACANVATLLAVRAASRQHDVSLRSALGCRRSGIVQQLVIESLVLACAGGLAGLAAAAGFLKLVVALAPPGIPRLAGARLDVTVVVTTFAMSAGCGLLFSLAPIWQSSRRDLASALKSGARSGDAPSHQRLRRILIVAEVALSMTLLTTAGLLAQTTRALSSVALGFDDAGVFRVDRIELPQGTAAGSVANFYERLQASLRAAPGITAAGATLAVPLDPQGRFYIDETPFTIDGHAPVANAARPEARIQVVTGGFFKSLGIRLISGRNFEERDGPSAPPVAIINEALASREFPQGDAVGRWLTHDLTIVEGQPVHRQIVGVAANVRQFNLDDPFEPQIFVPHAQMPWPAMALVIRSAMTPDRVTAAVRSAVWAIDPKRPVPPAVPVADTLSGALGQPRLRALLIAGLAATALVLAAIGLYGIVTFDVEQQRRELAIRLMLGATSGRTRALVMRDALVLVATGAIAGLSATYWVGQSLASLLFGVRSGDPGTIAIVTGVLLLVTASACYLGTRQISRIDPIRTMTSG